ncbi:MAG: ISNCY family transposase [Oligoflexia bacterium]|nr:ISNCY family transposase [Oligoflexia bacterium]
MFTQKDQLKFEIISKVVAGLIDSKLAAQALHVSYRTIGRYKKGFLKKGSTFLFHGNRGRTSHNATSAEVKEKIINQLIEKYFDFSISHAWEKLKEDDLQIVGYKTLLRWCHEKKYIKRMRRRKKIHRMRARMPRIGMMLLMDGSYDSWYGNQKSCLIAAVDDANNEIPYAEFFDSESTLSCMKVIQKIIETKGIFDILYVDKAGVFGGNKRQDFCQVEEACKVMGIQIIYAHTAEAKGRIERLWRTLQGRLIPEMRLANIQTRKQANKYLQEYFLPNEYDPKFIKTPTSNQSNYKVNFRNDLKEIFCKKEYRTIKSDQTFNYASDTYLINKFMGNLKGKLVQIRTYQDGSIQFFWADKILDVIKFDGRISEAA